MHYQNLKCSQKYNLILCLLNMCRDKSCHGNQRKSVINCNQMYSQETVANEESTVAIMSVPKLHCPESLYKQRTQRIPFTTLYTATCFSQCETRSVTRYRRSHHLLCIWCTAPSIKGSAQKWAPCSLCHWSQATPDWWAPIRVWCIPIFFRFNFQSNHRFTKGMFHCPFCLIFSLICIDCCYTNRFSVIYPMKLSYHIS